MVRPHFPSSRSFRLEISLEKEAVRQLITSAIKGLEDTGRIQPTAYYEENGKGTQVNLDALGSLISNK